MRLVSNWKEIIRKAWSVRLAALAAVLAALEVALPLLEDSIPHGLFAALSLVASKAAVVSRVVDQENLNETNG